MMAYLDITDDKRILDCDEDLRPFVSGAYQARYCSERCRRRAIKRAYRHRLRERAAAEDASVPEPGEGQTPTLLARNASVANARGKRTRAKSRLSDSEEQGEGVNDG